MNLLSQKPFKYQFSYAMDHDLQWWAPLKRIEDLFILPPVVMPQITAVKSVDIEGRAEK